MSTGGAAWSENSEWVAAFYRAVDSKQIETLSPWFADDVELRFANAPPLHGKAAAIAALQGFYATITGLRHRQTELIEDGNRICIESVITYTTLDGRDVDVPCSSLLRRSTDSLVGSLRIYIDLAPLHAAAA